MPTGHPLTSTERAARDLETAVAKLVKAALEADARATAAEAKLAGLRDALGGGS